VMLSPISVVAESVIDPHEAVYGYYADNYKSNISDNKTPDTNVAIGMLNGFADLWEPGETWSTGTILNDAIIRTNIQKAYDIAGARTKEQEVKAHEIEFTHLNWVILDGLGEYKEKFIELSGIGDDTSEWKLKSSAKLYFPAYLADLFRNTAASTSAAKAYYSFPRPYRWKLDTMEVVTEGFVESQVVDTIIEEKGIASINGADDGGFPSGHTNGAFLAAYAIAYSVPQKFCDMLMTAAEVGNYRIIAGMHSPLDVMGGRLTATALSSSILADTKASTYTFVKAAYNKGQQNLVGENVIPEVATLEDYAAYKENLKQYIYYLTYDFEKIGETNVAMKVPKGAEALLSSRLPYLTDEQRRYVLYTTGLESGYPLLDDEEGWGRLNYYAAANGYAEFLTDVTVDMDASKGAYNACDSWLNDISGSGKLTKKGTGTLALVGNNTFTGGVTVENGTLIMVGANSLGTGDVIVTGGALTENIKGVSTIPGNYSQSGGDLVLTLDASGDKLDIAGNAKLGGKLVIELGEGMNIDETTVVLSAKTISGNFDSVEIKGMDKKYEAVVSGGNVTVKEASSSMIWILIAVAVVIVVIAVIMAVVVLKKKKSN